MDMKLFVRSLSEPEKKLLRDLLREQKLIEANVPTEISNLINAGDIRTASRRLMDISGMGLVEADATCRMYHKNLPKWKIKYMMHVDDFTFKPIDTPIHKSVEWHCLSEDVVRKRFGDTWRHLPTGSVVIGSLEKL